MERKLIALAVSAAITATFAAGTASAAQKTVTIQGTSGMNPSSSTRPTPAVRALRTSGN